MSQITIFSIPKGFENHVGIIQTNAIKSWTLLKPKPKIILFGDEKGTKEIAKKYGLTFFPNINRNKFNTPELDYIFNQSSVKSPSNIIAYINTDIILMQNFIKTIDVVKNKFDKFLIVGRRYELNIKNIVNYSSNWKDVFLNKYSKKNKLKSVSWVDYFVFTKKLYKKIPSFAVGRTFWDKWLIWYAHSKNYPIIDATNTITAIHQTHQYTQGEKSIWEGKEALNNIKLGGGWSHGYTINQANYKLNKDYSFSVSKHNWIFFFINRIKNYFNNLIFFYPTLLKIRYLKNKIQSNFPKEEN